MEMLRKTCLLLALLLVAAGCGGAAGSEEELYVFLPRSLDSQFWVDANEGLEAEAERLGVSAEFLGPTEEDPAEQVTLLEETIAREPAGIAVSADGTEEVEEALARAREAGIPVISWVSPLPEARRWPTWAPTTSPPARRPPGPWPKSWAERDRSPCSPPASKSRRPGSASKGSGKGWRTTRT
jgi:ABC-type sugar transport system substrate-binding protein